MKPITIHPGSALAGATIVVLAGVLSAQQIAPRFFNVHIKGPVLTEVAPHPRNFVRIVEGGPYSVPSDRRLVIYALGHNRPGTGLYNIQLHLNGVAETNVQAGSGSALYSQMTPLASPGWMVDAGALVEVIGGDTNPDDARAWGYLVDA